MIRLSPRLQLLLDLATPGEPLWDLCCDHGLLGRRALETGSFPEVHFVDQVPHIIEKLRARVGSIPAAQLHLLDAAMIAVPVRGTLIAAGVGGEKIINIINSLSTSRVLLANTLILGPQKHETKLIETMSHMPQWSIKALVSVAENGRNRKILQVIRNV